MTRSSLCHFTARIIEHIDDSLTVGVSAADRAAATAALRVIAGVTLPGSA
ncbi:MAG TPA: hypothetical protein VH021_26025 [Trebonia sp.]|nr:hypothetical protein [Trebonia sp.]